MDKKYIVNIKNIPSKEINERELKEYIEKHSNIFSFVWTNKEFSNLLNGRYFSNMREIKRIYPGQTYLFYPFRKNENINLTNEDSILDGYIAVSKRGFRTEYSYLKYDRISVLKEEIKKKLLEYVNNINLFQNGNLYECVLSDVKTKEVLDTITVHLIDNNTIFDYVINNTKILDANIKNTFFIQK